MAVEYLRAYFLTGFPWYYLAHSQYRYLYVIQIADVTGSLGISLLIAMVNAWLVDLVTLPLFRRAAAADRPRLTPGPVGPALGGHAPRRGHPLLRGLPALDGPVPRRAPGRALAVEPRCRGNKFRNDPNEVTRAFEALIRRGVAGTAAPT